MGVVYGEGMSATWERATLDQAFEWLDALRFTLAIATVSPSRAVGRALLFEFRAANALPASDRAVINGYALRACHTEGAGPYNPLPVSATAIRAGDTLPAGTDAVLQADLMEQGCALEPVGSGENVSTAGSQLRLDERVFPAGHILRPQDVAVLSELGVATVQVRAGLTVAGVVGPALEELGAGLLWRDFSQWDSEGDIVLTTVEAPGDRWDIRSLAARPCGGSALGFRDGRPALKLPDDYVGFTIGYELLAARLIRAHAGFGPASATVQCPLAGKIVSAIGLADVVLIKLVGGMARPLPGIETAGAAALAKADGYTIVPPTREGMAPGDLVTVHVFGS